MASKLSAKAQNRIAALHEASRHWDRIRSLVEQYGSARVGEDMFLGQISRGATQVNRIFMSNGYGIMADSANQLAMLARRGVGKQTKLRGMREFVGSVKAAMEQAERLVVEEDRKEQGGSGTEA